MPLNHFRPRPGRLGTELIQVRVGNPGAIDPAATASATTIYKVPPAYGRYFLEKVSLFIGTLATGGSTITAQPFKRNSVGTVSQALAAAADLKSGSVNTVRQLAITANDSQRYFNAGDYFAVDVVAAGTITVQPADLYVVAEFAVLE